MKVKIFATAISILIVLVALAGACKTPQVTGTFTDDMGRQVTIEKVPQRIVSHVPSITETIYALSLQDKLVGVSDYDDYPPEAKSKPSVGNYFNPSIEKIVSLNPDLVLTDGHSENVKQLDNLGIKYIVIDPKTLDDIYRDNELLGKVTGTEKKAREVTKNMQEVVSRISNLVKDAPKVKVFYLIDGTDLSSPWTAGPGSFIDMMVTLAGGENVASKVAGAWAQMSIEQIVSADPDTILLPAQHGTAFTLVEALRKHPGWKETAAVKQGKVIVIDADPVETTGPRIVQGLEEIASSIHPELFK